MGFDTIEILRVTIQTIIAIFNLNALVPMNKNI